jgi:hypothetical protein
MHIHPDRILKVSDIEEVGTTGSKASENIGANQILN